MLLCFRHNFSIYNNKWQLMLNSAHLNSLAGLIDVAFNVRKQANRRQVHFLNQILILSGAYGTFDVNFFPIRLAVIAYCYGSPFCQCDERKRSCKSL